PACAATAVWWSSPEEIDAYGLAAALGLACRRACHELVTTANSIPNGLVLDGNAMWLHNAPEALTELLSPVESEVMLQTNADAKCATDSAAALTAEVSRDALVGQLA